MQRRVGALQQRKAAVAPTVEERRRSSSSPARPHGAETPRRDDAPAPGEQRKKLANFLCAVADKPAIARRTPPTVSEIAAKRCAGLAGRTPTSTALATADSISVSSSAVAVTHRQRPGARCHQPGLEKVSTGDERHHRISKADQALEAYAIRGFEQADAGQAGLAEKIAFCLKASETRHGRDSGPCHWGRSLRREVRPAQCAAACR